LQAELDISLPPNADTATADNLKHSNSAPAIPLDPGKSGAQEKSVAPPAAKTVPQSAVSKWRGRIAKSSVALAILVAVVWAPLQLLLQPSSVEAVINARLIVLRSPIEGIVKSDALPAPGDTLAKANPILSIEDLRADTSERQSLTQQLRQVQFRNLIESRQQILTTEIGIAEQRIAAAQQQWLIDRDEAQRASALMGAGVVATSSADKSVRVAQISQSNLTLLKLQRDRLQIERDALSRGILVDGGYNDRPQSQQRLDQLHSDIADLEAQILSADNRTKSLGAALQDAEVMYDRRSRATLTSPQRGRVWEVLVSPGEQVNRGQDLVRLLSCEEAVVTAAVDERVYNSLYNGMSATFIPRGSRDEFSGTIVNLTGMASASSNYAITPASLVQEPYRVTVSVPQLATKDDCAIGRTGRVLFGNDADTSETDKIIRFVRSFFP
jgi:multidrug resistance efflux pump